MRRVRELAWDVGTSSRRVVLHSADKLSSTADGTRILLGRTIQARLNGQPGLVVQPHAGSAECGRARMILAAGTGKNP